MASNFFVKLALAVLLTSETTQAAGPQCSAIFSEEKTIALNYEGFKENKISLLRDINSLQHLKVFSEYQKMFNAASEDKNSPLFEARFQDIIRKSLSSFSTNSEHLTASDLAYITASTKREKLFEELLYYQVLLEAPLRMMQRYTQYTATRGGSLDFLSAPSKRKAVQHLLQTLYNGPLKYMLLIPTGVDLPGGLTPTQKIFKKLWKNNNYQPTSAEQSILKEYKAEKIFQERKAFLNEHRQWVQIRRMGDYALNAILALSMLEAFNWYEQLQAPESTVLADDFLNTESYRLQDDEVRIYNETVPFPHMAIEIDGLVYSYGQTHMTVKSAREYLLTEVIQEGLNPTKNQDTNALNKVISVMGLNKTERVVQTARLRIGKAAKSKMQRYLELQTGKRYRNNTFVMDCSSMVVKALKEQGQTNIPTIIDPSPSQVMFYLGNLKSLDIKNNQGESLVTQLLQVRIAKTSQKKNHLWRNLYINMMETRIYWSFAHFSVAQRTYLEARYGKNDLQYWDSETLDYFKTWDQDIRKDFAEKALTGQLSFFKDSLKTQDPKMKEYLRLAMNAYFSLEESQLKEILESSSSRFEEIYRATLNLALLQEAKQQMYQEAELPLH